MGNRVRWLLLTPEGRRMLMALYVIAAAVSIVANFVLRGPLFALSVAVPLTFAPFWATWCLRRPWT